MGKRPLHPSRLLRGREIALADSGAEYISRAVMLLYEHAPQIPQQKRDELRKAIAALRLLHDDANQ